MISSSSPVAKIGIVQSIVPGWGTPRLATLLAVLLLAVATVLLYLPTLANDFINYDDPAYVTSNSYVQQGITRESVAWAFKTTTEANWHPLTWISHMVDVQLFGLNSLGHHLTSTLLHVINVVVLFLLLRNATGCIWRSSLVAGLFAIHPLNVESVAWVAERKSLLCTLFMLLAIWAYYRYARKPSLIRYSNIVLWFALALMAKPMALTLPVLFLLLDYWPLGRISNRETACSGNIRPLSRLIAEKVPLLVLSLGSALITMYAQARGGAVGNFYSLPLGLRVKNAIYSYLSYILKGIWPSHLAVFYPHPENSLAWWKVSVAALFLALVTGLVWRYRERRYLVTGWLGYLVAMIPVIGIVQVGRQAMADRYAYIPFLGLFAIVVWLAADLSKEHRMVRQVLAGGVIIVLCSYIYISSVQLRYWRNSYTLFSHALDVTRDNGIAEDNLGQALYTQGQRELAMQHFAAAVRLIPQLSTAHYNLGTMMHLHGRYDEAMREYQLALDYASDPLVMAQTHNNLGALLLENRQPAAALAHFNAAITLNPREQNSFVGRGIVEYKSGNVDAAIADLTHASRLGPSPLALLWLDRISQRRAALKPTSR